MMNAVKMLISLPNDLTARFRAIVPARQRSRVIRRLLEDEVNQREKALYECARLVEQDVALQKA